MILMIFKIAKTYVNAAANFEMMQKLYPEKQRHSLRYYSTHVYLLSFNSKIEEIPTVRLEFFFFDTLSDHPVGYCSQHAG